MTRQVEPHAERVTVQEDGAGPSTWHRVTQRGWIVNRKVELTRRTLRIPFHTPSHALVAQRALSVDKEQNAQLVRREIEVDGSDLVVNYSTATVRLLRLATNSFFSSVDVLVRTMEAFAPDPSDRRKTDEEMESIRREANAGAATGIELRGDGVGAGSGEEVR